jgi:hypothetical protein
MRERIVPAVQFACLGMGAGRQSAIADFAQSAPEPEPEPAPQVAAAPAMPRTATWLLLAGTIGIVLLALGAGISLLRRRSHA